MFTKGEGGFLDRGLYVFCSNVSDGKLIAIGNPNTEQLLGTDARPLKDSAGKAFGQEVYAAGQKPDGEITEVTGYLFPSPSSPTPVLKNSFVTRIGDIFCGLATTTTNSSTNSAICERRRGLLLQSLDSEKAEFSHLLAERQKLFERR
jgi:hypothetical protein